VSGGLAAIGVGVNFVFLIVAAVGFAFVAGLWALLARSAFIQGDDDMERPNRVAQLYGYAVCLIAVIVILMSANSFVENAFTLSNPLRARQQFGMEPAVSSFEAYRASLGRFGPSSPGTPSPPPPDSVLRARYEALRSDRMDQSRFEAERGLTTSGISMLLAIILFVVHWRWMRARDAASPVPVPPR
jgi:hypothetical protein